MNSLKKSILALSILVATSIAQAEMKHTDECTQRCLDRMKTNITSLMKNKNITADCKKNCQEMLDDIKECESKMMHEKPGTLCQACHADRIAFNADLLKRINADSELKKDCTEIQKDAATCKKVCKKQAPAKEKQAPKKPKPHTSTAHGDVTKGHAGHSQKAQN